VGACFLYTFSGLIIEIYESYQITEKIKIPHHP